MNEKMFVEKRYQDEALKVLEQRISRGETLLRILNIREEYMYYANKIRKGLTPMSYDIYDRIMLCSITDASL